MEVVFWQIAVIASIIACRFCLSKYTIWLCGLWTVWTLMMLFYTPLIAIQLLSIWVTWFVLLNLKQKQSQIDARDELIATLTMSVEARSAVEATPKDQIRTIAGKEHLDFLHKGIERAKNVIVILSGWVSDSVLTDRMIQLLDHRLRDGCNVFIAYGWENRHGRHDESPAATRALRKLASLERRHGDILLVAKFATHEKLLVVDDEVVYGSNNRLSNSAFKNAERSLAVVNADLAKKERTRVQQLVRTHVNR